jgi:hypothetical protein
MRVPDRATARLSDTAAAARQDAMKDKKVRRKGRRRMSSLQYGVAPKMKPVSPRRPALVAALDIGTSKIVCLIAG